MHRDPNLPKRNALAIPGTLLLVLGLVGIVYVQLLRPDTVECEDGTLVVLAGACRSASALLMVPIALGALLVGLSFAFRPRTSCHLGHGTGSAVVLSVLIAATALPALGALVLYGLEDPEIPYTLTYNDVAFSQVRLFGLAALVGAVALVPYLGLFIATARPQRCCRDKGCFEPCFCDEPASGGALPPQDNAYVTSAPWPPAPASRPAPAPTPAPTLPPAAPPVVTHDPWPAHAAVAPMPAEAPVENAPKGRPAPVRKAKASRKITRRKGA